MKDPIVQEIRDIRDAHAAKFGYNFDAMAGDWLKQQAAAKRGGQKFVDLSSKALEKSKKEKRP